jgi:hypothetical protein
MISMLRKYLVNYLFSNAQKALGDQIASTNVNLNIFKLWAQYWTETTYTDEANYDIVTRTIADNTFQVFYRDILVDLKEARRVISAEVPITDIETTNRQNRLYIIDLVEAYAYNYLLETFGDIPYTEALDIENISPKYDDAQTIYLDLLSKVKTATDGIVDDAEIGGFGVADLFFGRPEFTDTDLTMWKKFGNSLQVKMAITLADVDEGTSRTYIESAAPGAFQEGEAATMIYPGGSNSNPLYLDMVASGRDDFVPANTIIDIMNDLEDPRRDDYFFANSEDSTYTGGVYGESSPFGQLSHVADPILDPTFPVTFIDYTEIQFYLAEAAARGFSVGQTAEEYYNEAIRSSIVDWGGTEEEATEYLANPEVAYGTPSGDEWRDKIGTQAWLAFYTRGLEGYTIWRRLDAPTFNIAPTIQSEDEIPLRFTYPINEQTLNASNYSAAAAAIGGDELTTPLFWDVY